jgi:hypothetical protein
MPQNSISITMRTKPLSRAELEHRYRQGLRKLRGPTFLRRIRMTDKTVRGLINRGYLGPEERDNLTAIQQAMSLFLWDDLREQAKTKRTKRDHVLRHACGYKLANDGHDTRSLQAYLGHCNIQNYHALHRLGAGSI